MEERTYVMRDLSEKVTVEMKLENEEQMVNGFRNTGMINESSDNFRLSDFLPVFFFGSCYKSSFKLYWNNIATHRPKHIK